VYKKILLATDGSSSAHKALEHAAQVASACGAKIFVVYAYPPVPDFVGSDWQKKIIADSTAKGEEVVDEAVSYLNDMGVESEPELVEGPPARAIIRVANAQDCDLIVMGNRGYSVFTEIMLGSVSMRVLTHCKIPVLIVKEERD